MAGYRFGVIAILALAAAATPAAAQTPAPRFWVDVSGGWTKPITRWETVSRDESLFGETATRRVIYPPMASAGALQIEVGYRWRPKLGASVKFGTGLSSSFQAGLGVQIPSPTFTNTFATANDTTAVLPRTANSIDFAVSYDAWTHGRWQVRLFGGPSVVWMSQDVVSAISYDQTFTASAPINVVDITAHETASRSASTIGVNAGVDASWMWTQRFGLTAAVRGLMSKPRLDDPLTESPINLTVGGLWIGGGLRIRF